MEDVPQRAEYREGPSLKEYIFDLSFCSWDGGAWSSEGEFIINETAATRAALRGGEVEINPIISHELADLN